MNVVLSIVVPVYNAENYLRDCLDSLLVQMNPTMEIILVDDGSADGSEQICDEYAQAYEIVYAIHQENQGVVCARAKGVTIATGKYVTFVDADDVILPDMIECFMKEPDDIDLLTSGVRQEIKSGRHIDLTDGIPEGEYRSEDEYCYILSNMIRFEMRNQDGILPFCYAKRYKRDLLLSVMGRLDTRIHYAEDRELVYRYMIEARTAKVMYDSWYVYRYHNESVLHSVNSNAMHDLNYLYDALMPLFQSHIYSDTLVRQLQAVIASRIYLLSAYMGFDYECQTVRYIFPFYNLLDNAKVILYGAGVVGCNYYRQTENCVEFSWVLWVDKNIRNERVTGVEEIHNTDYDYIVIAIKDEDTAGAIRKELCDMNVPDERILWKPPIVLAE